MRTPVALLIFRRPETTARVFAAIAEAKPRKLLVVANSPRPEVPGEAEKCRAARAVVERVDWDCEVLTNYSEAYRDGRAQLCGGLDWVFRTVKEAVILEDDCLPHPSFFRYCDELLEMYRDDERVMMVSGMNYLREWKPGLQSYHFSHFGGTWGWASWRRAWRYFDADMALWPRVRESGFLENFLRKPAAVREWKTIFQKTYEREIGTWDYQWKLACWINSGLSIFPSVNMISNIGFGADATHTFEENSLSNLPARATEFPLAHPPYVARDFDADDLVLDQFYTSPAADLPARLKARASRLLKLSRTATDRA
jgi:hypothetical protein